MDDQSHPQTTSAEQLALNHELKASSGEPKVLSPVSVASLPVHRQQSQSTQNRKNANNNPAQTTHKAVSRSGQKRKSGCYEASVDKKPKITRHSSNSTNSKQFTITPAQTPASFRSLKVTKPRDKGQHPSLVKSFDTGLPVACAGHTLDDRGNPESQDSTIEQCTPQTASSTSRALLDALNTEIPSKPIVDSSDHVGVCENRDRSSAETNTIYATTATHGCSSNPSDAYPLDADIADDDIIQLLNDTQGSIKERHIPPSSLQGWDYESQSAQEYDPSLKYSPPKVEGPDINVVNPDRVSPGSAAEASEDLLDEGVDWKAVLTNMDTMMTYPSSDHFPESDKPDTERAAMCAKETGDRGSQANKPGALIAFVRPPFPEKVRDRPLVPGMSSNTLLRTCFRIGVMISQTVHCFNHKQDVTFELYARVTYSSRETLARKQHFQFVDLYKDQQPYPAATLANWRVGSQLDKDSSTFLDTAEGPRLCWCLCKPTRDPRAAVGWTYTVLNIREIDREQLDWAKRIICADETIAAKL
ncbi:hypothetical protein F4808DRAFT_345991 [Astrocystis sublimbata]|nr:hypothetical protein F4808DRAFT_345991 [Astrocystis sublimbata]